MPHAYSRREAGDDLQRRVDGGRGRHRAVAIDAVLQRPAGDEFHRDDRRAVDFFGAEDVNRVGVAERRRELTFAQEPGAVGVGREALAEDLERDAPAVRTVRRFVDFAHAAASQQAFDAVRAEVLAGVKARGVRGGGRVGGGVGGRGGDQPRQVRHVVVVQVRHVGSAPWSLRSIGVSVQYTGGRAATGSGSSGEKGVTAR